MQYCCNSGVFFRPKFPDRQKISFSNSGTKSQFYRLYYWPFVRLLGRTEYIGKFLKNQKPWMNESTMPLSTLHCLNIRPKGRCWQTEPLRGHLTTMGCHRLQSSFKGGLQDEAAKIDTITLQKIHQCFETFLDPNHRGGKRQLSYTSKFLATIFFTWKTT